MKKISVDEETKKILNDIVDGLNDHLTETISNKLEELLKTQKDNNEYYKDIRKSLNGLQGLNIDKSIQNINNEIENISNKQDEYSTEIKCLVDHLKKPWWKKLL